MAYPFDSKSLNGLRGIASLHILVYHALLKTTFEGFNTYGQVSFELEKIICALSHAHL